MANKKDFATSNVLVAPSPADSGTTLVVQAGHGARFPAAPFYVTAHPPSEMPTLDNAEKLLVSDKSDDTFTITRSQGDTTAKTIEAGWRVSNALFLDDIPSGDVVGAAGVIASTLPVYSGTTGKLLTTSNIKHAQSVGWESLGTTSGMELRLETNNGANDELITANGAPVVTTTATQTLTNKTLTSPVLNTGVSGTAVLDEDTMVSNSATQLATQQSIKAYADNLPTAKQLAKTPPSNTDYHELLRTGVPPVSSWVMLVVDVFNCYGSSSNMEYARYKINMTVNSAALPLSLAMAKVYGDTLTAGVLTAVANSNGTISLWGRSATSAYRTTGITYAYTMINAGNMLTITHPMTSQAGAPTGTYVLGVS